MRQWVWLVLAGAAGVGLAVWLHLPVPWMIGPLLVALLLALWQGHPLPQPAEAMNAAQVVLGVAIGLSFNLAVLRNMGAHLGWVVTAALLIVLVSLGNGLALSRWTRLGRASALMGTLPGAASGMVAMSEDLGADTRAVAALQYLRLLLLLLAVPPLIAGLGWHGPHWGQAVLGLAGGSSQVSPWAWGVLALGATLGLWLARVLHLPAGNFVGPMFVAMLPLVFGLQGWALPGWLTNLAFAVVGVLVGGRFDRAALRHIARILPAGLALTVALTIWSFAIAWGLARLAGWDWLTTWLGVMPGGMEAMLATGLQNGADVPTIAALQTARYFATLFLAPWVVQRMVRRAAWPARHGHAAG